MTTGGFQQSRRIAPGTRLNGIYEIDEQIGAGGMGEIYKGRSIQTGDPVAIKLMLPDLAERYGAGRIRTTVEQKLVILDIPENDVETVISELDALDLQVRPSPFRRWIAR